MTNNFNFSQSKKIWTQKLREASLRNIFGAAILLIIALPLGRFINFAFKLEASFFETFHFDVLYWGVAILFINLLTLQAMYGRKDHTGYLIFRDYAKADYLESPFHLHNEPKVICRELVKLNGRTYGQLNELEKSILHQSFVNEWCMVEWFFDRKILKEICECKNENELKEVISNSSKIIKMKDELILLEPGIRKIIKASNKKESFFS